LKGRGETWSRGEKRTPGRQTLTDLFPRRTMRRSKKIVRKGEKVYFPDGDGNQKREGLSEKRTGADSTLSWRERRKARPRRKKTGHFRTRKRVREMII